MNTVMRKEAAVGDTVVVDGQPLTVTSIGGEPGRYIYLRSRVMRGEVQVAREDLRWDAIRERWIVAR